MNNHSNAPKHPQDVVRAGRLALVLLWKDDRPDGELQELRLAWAEDYPGAGPQTRAARELAPLLQDYAAGKPVRWPDLDLDFESLPPFRARILRTLLQEVGPGQTVTYGQLSRMAGHPRAARAVGQAMANNPWPLLVPCHRVLDSGGKLHGFSGAGLNMKEYLLKLEGAI